MPGLSGFVSDHAKIDNPDQIVKTFEKVHSLNEVRFEYRTFHLDHCVIVNTLSGLLRASLDQPAFDPARNNFLFLEGEIFNAIELLQCLSEPRGSSQCRILLDLFLSHGPDFVSLIDGVFNIVIYQKAEKRLLILNDHLASKPMYYMEQADSLLFGSEKKSILAVSKTAPDIDPVGLLQMFAHRHNVGEKTFIDGLKHLPPASRLEYCEGRLSLTRLPSLRFNVPPVLPRVSVLVEEWGEHLKRATVQRLKGKERVLISLSGGLDSRAVACAIPREWRPLVARTRGYQNSLEVTYAAEIAQRLSLIHFLENPEMALLSDVLFKIVWRTEGAVLFTNAATIGNHRAIKQNGDFIIGGQLGDVGSGSHISPFMLLPDSRHHFIDATYQWYLLYPESALREVFNPRFLSRNFPGLRDTFFDSFASLEGETNIQMYELWDLYERQARMTLSAAPADTYYFEHIRPFLDKNYLGFVLSLPTHLRFGQILYQSMIYRLGPEIRDIPNANTNLKLNASLFRGMLNTGIAFADKAMSKVLARMRLQTAGRSSKAPLGNLTTATRQDLALRHLIEGFVHSSQFDSSIFNGPGILNMVDRHYRRTADHAHLLCILATFIVSLSYFVYNRPLHCPPEAEPLLEPVNAQKFGL